jgi:asparagine synthase (glutamine-hydrolysing)
VRAFADGASAIGALRRMADLLQHRGPDESGVWVGEDVGLAHTGWGGPDEPHPRQPIHSADGRWVLALDGRVTNLDTLRSHLDHRSRTRGDAEVVVAGLARDGISFVERVQGPFALVAHDLRTGTTHLVRDRLGVRPLYYRHVPGGIAFGSEVKALLALGPPPQVDRRSLDAYLGSGVVPAPDTLFEGVKHVRPAHRLSIMPGGHLEEAHYWTPPEPDPEGTWSTEDAIEAVGDGVREAVRSALDEDAPVGAFLSGGLSGGLAESLVVAQVQRLRGDESVQTFAAGFAGQVPDELPWARRVSTLLGTQHHEVRLLPADFDDLWALLTWHRDAPLSGPGDVVAYGLARAAREHVRVVLSGAGGDELFAGRPEHRYARLAERSAVLPARLRHTLAGPVERRLGAPRSASFTPAERRRLLGLPSAPERRTSPTPGADPLDRMLRHDLRHWLPDRLLEPEDRMSMAASMEVRAPLLDLGLVELAFRLPSSVKVHAGTSEWVLREVARALLPEHVVDRRTAGVRVPRAAWWSSGLRDTVRERLTGSDSWVGQTMERSLVDDLVVRHERGDDDDPRLWMLLSLEMWHSCFFGPAPTVPHPRPGGIAPAPVAPVITGA